jgi:UDP-3-O-[3-hydroxymyristoyl] glucosamine N-acyltransferase
MNTICSSSEHSDRIKLGKNIVIHPFVSIQPLVGPIIIEDGVIIEEKAQITNNKSTNLVIGSYSHIQVGSTIVDSNIGSNCILQPRCRFGFWFNLQPYLNQSIWVIIALSERNLAFMAQKIFHRILS